MCVSKICCVVFVWGMCMIIGLKAGTECAKNLCASEDEQANLMIKVETCFYWDSQNQIYARGDEAGCPWSRTLFREFFQKAVEACG